MSGEDGPRVAVLSKGVLEERGSSLLLLESRLVPLKRLVEIWLPRRAAPLEPETRRTLIADERRLKSVCRNAFCPERSNAMRLQVLRMMTLSCRSHSRQPESSCGAIDESPDIGLGSWSDVGPHGS